MQKARLDRLVAILLAIDPARFDQSLWINIVHDRVVASAAAWAALDPELHDQGFLLVTEIQNGIVQPIFFENDFLDYVKRHGLYFCLTNTFIRYRGLSPIESISAFFGLSIQQALRLFIPQKHYMPLSGLISELQVVNHCASEASPRKSSVP